MMGLHRCPFDKLFVVDHDPVQSSASTMNEGFSFSREVIFVDGELKRGLSDP